MSNFKLMSEYDIQWWKYVNTLDISKFKIIDEPIVAELIDTIIEFQKTKLMHLKEIPVFPNIGLDIVQYKKNPEILRQKSYEVPLKDITSLEFKYFGLLLLLSVMISESTIGTAGVGLSAIQVGIPWRVFWAYVFKNENWELMVNPEFTIIDEHMEAKKEGCLSVVGEYIPVSRYKQIKVKYLNSFGIKNKLQLKNFDARVIQHEYDHLEGKLIVDYKK